MPISILLPAPPLDVYDAASEDELDSEGDVDMQDGPPTAKRIKLSKQSLVTPGETITDDPQWMRCCVSSVNDSSGPS